jgi:DNA-binding SARP family transcriptional activator/tetratricopeptide (TPR) repeat protein
MTTGPARVTEQRVVHVLGPLAITTLGGQPLESVPAGRASILLLRIAAAAGKNVTVDQAIDALWPTSGPTSAPRVVASLMSRIRGALGPDVIAGTATTGYRFGIGPNWTTDVVQVERDIDEAQARSASAPALAAATAQRGLDRLDRGEAVNGTTAFDGEWVDVVNHHVKGLRRKLQRCLWEADIELERWSELIDSTEAALAAEPYDEAAGRTLMIAHWNRGDRGLALLTHDRLRARLLDELGVEPSAETDALYSAIVRDGHASMRVRREHPRLPIGDVHMAGRGDDLDQLVDQWHRAAAGNVVSVMVSGPIGSGRTNLCRALADIVERTGGRVLRAESAEGERSLFLNPLLTMIARAVLSTPADDIPDMLGPYLGTVAELVPELRQVCPVEPYQRAAADLEHRRALQAIAHIISTLARKRPLLMIFGYLHHAGASTIDALQWLRHELRGQPVMLIATINADHGDARLDDFATSSTVVTLRPVTAASVAALSADAGFPEAADYVWELTQGHLLFVKSVLDALRRGVPVEEITGTIGSVVLDSARRAGDSVLSVVQVASVVGTTFDLRTLEHISDLSHDTLIGCLESAMAASLVEPRDDRFAFSNRLIQQVFYHSMVEPIRRERHRRVAEMSDDKPERQAWHLKLAGELADASGAWIRAARVAQRAFSNTDAERLYTEAIDASERCNDDDNLGRALIERGIVRTELGAYQLAADDHHRAERLAIGLGDRQMRARAVERLGWTAYYERDVDTAIVRAEEAAAIPGAHPSARVLLGRTRHWAGDFVGAHAAYHQALAELDDDDGVKASALSCLGALLAHADRYEEAIDVLDEALVLCHEIGALRPLLRSLFFEGLARANLGDLSGALTTFETKRTILDRYDVQFYRARTNTCLAWIWRELGDLGRARELSELALGQSREVDERELQVEQELHALCSLAECSMIDGDTDVSAERLSDAHALLDQWLPFRWRAELRVMELKCRIGLASAEQLLEDARHRGSTKYHALALHLLGRTEEASTVAATTGSSLLIAEVATPDLASAASARLVTRLPRELRTSFQQHGRLARLQR